MIKKTIKIVFNYFGYSLVKRISQPGTGTSLIKVGNFTIEINNNNGIKYCYEYCSEYGRQLSRLTKVVNKYHPELHVVDVGANLGDSVALIKTGADVPVISVEGDKSLFNLYNANTRQFKNVRLIPAFLSENETELDCALTKVGHNLTITPSQKSQTTTLTKFTSIDILFTNSVLNKNCKLLKIDTEGFDLKVLRGGSFYLKVIKPVILFEFNRENLTHTESDPFSIFSWLQEHSYNNILFYESDGRFMFSSNLKNHNFLKQVYDYVDGKNAKIYYLDIIVFHAADDNIAREFIEQEADHRLSIK